MKRLEVKKIMKVCVVRYQRCVRREGIKEEGKGRLKKKTKTEKYTVDQCL